MAQGIFQTCGSLFHRKTGIEEWEKGEFGFQDCVEQEEQLCLGFAFFSFLMDLSHPRNFLIQELLFPSWSFFGICLLQALKFQLNSLFPGKSEVSAWDLASSRYPGAPGAFPGGILPSSSSRTDPCFCCDWNILSAPGSWNSKSTDPSRDPGASRASKILGIFAS